MGRKKATTKIIMTGSTKNPMQIITRNSTTFNTAAKKIIIYGPTEIPEGHPLFGKKLYRHGTYTRTLLLFNRVMVTVVIFRFLEILPPGSKQKYATYSLLPSCISPFQRHINDTIDEVVEAFFLNHKSLFGISAEIDIGITTVKRWIVKFEARAQELDEKAESLASESIPGYKPAAHFVNNIYDRVKSIFRKVFLLKEKDCAVTSWLNLTFQT